MQPIRGDYYYSNVAMVLSSPVDVSIVFGRYVSAFSPSEGQKTFPVYEKQILMTLDQAEHLVETLARAVEDLKKRKAAEASASVK
jgi:hypothetical protein